MNFNNLTQEKSKSKIYYDYSSKNIDKFCRNLRQNVTDLNNIDNFDDFTEFYKSSIDQSCKLETPRMTKRTSTVNPWITNGIITSVKEKIRLYEDWTKSKCNVKPEGDCDKYNLYKEHRRVLRKTIKLAKKNHYGKKFEKFKMDPKKTWSVINDLRGKNKTLTKASFLIGSERIDCRRTIATKFNEYFVSLASNLNKSLDQDCGIPICNIPQFSDYLSDKVDTSIYLHNTDESEIIDIIKEFENGKASDIPVSLIKQSAKIICPVLVKLYNKCMSVGDFPEIFKIGKITPIFKKGNAELLENYRPISILPIFGKIFEKIIYKRLYSFLTAKNVLSNNQYGFRKGRSTVNALHNSVKIIEDAMNNNMHTIGIL